jgi:hypothetical protein
MASPELLKRWKATTALLKRAYRAIPPDSTETENRVVNLKKEFDEFLEHNELELALNCLEEIATLVPCRGGFWRDLERAAQMMKLEERAQQFRIQFLKTLPKSGRLKK